MCTDSVCLQRGTVLRSYPPMSLAPLGLDEVALELLKSMIEYEPDERVTAKDALHHRYFDDLPSQLKGTA